MHADTALFHASLHENGRGTQSGREKMDRAMGQTGTFRNRRPMNGIERKRRHLRCQYGRKIDDHDLRISLPLGRRYGSI